MRLFLLVSLTMAAFAANSILSRLAIGGGHMDAGSFGLLRLASGAAMLVVLCQAQGLAVRQGLRESLGGGAALTLYIAGFSLAYQQLDAGLGALVLFGVVQVTMFLWGAVRGNPVSAGQLAGAVLAFLGLAYVVWPDGSGTTPLGASLLMAAAGLGWGIYSILGRGAAQPLAATAVNFLWSTAMFLPVALWLGGSTVSFYGAVLAVLSGAVTSGMGYALWYRLLPQILPAVAATVQLSVPVIAILAGAVLLGETVTLRLLFGSATVLGGIALVVLRAPGRKAQPAKRTAG
ncbi:DMT family transporter [Leisingera aquaemixtae]|uniref:DMT family transporter n=1 Tax=Leisingera aquaemixtae TaxID=1396826 RepID=UPI0021A67B17|nr:DMT family transporter [Leisingera aquaemixtae]UWQ38289.1 DMT family transporter [Leisingera aquaemixtae]